MIRSSLNFIEIQMGHTMHCTSDVCVMCVGAGGCVWGRGGWLCGVYGSVHVCVCVVGVGGCI